MSIIKNVPKETVMVKLHPLLVPYIEAITIEKNDLILPTTQRIYKVMPTSSLVMGFQYRGRLRIVKDTQSQLLNRSGITGLQTTYRLFQADSNTRTILVRFKPWGAAVFVEAPLHNFTDASLPLCDLLLERSIAEIEEKLSLSNGDVAVLSDIIQNFLCQWLLQKKRKTPKDNLIAAIKEMYQNDGTRKIEAIAKAYGFTTRSLERNFKEMVGLSPKKFSRIVRFEKVLRLLANPNGQKREVERDHYFDQAHFIRDFKKLSGVTPGEFLQKPF